MTQTTLTTHVEKAQEALTTLLKTLIGTEVPIETSAPVSVDDPSGAGVEERFSLHAADADIVVALDSAWVAVLSEAMLGEAVEPDSDGAIDLMQELASQGFGTVQSTLAAEGLELSTIQFEAEVPGTLPSSLDGSFWQVEFAAQHDEKQLGGVALIPGGEETSETESAATESTSAQAEARSPGQPSQAGGATEPTAEPSGGGAQGSEVEVAPAAFSELGDEDLGSNGDDSGNFELLAEVNLEVRVELGRRELPLADVLKLTTGSVVELEKMVGEPLSVYANGRLIAEGEAVVIDEQFGVRITNLASESHREKAFF